MSRRIEDHRVTLTDRTSDLEKRRAEPAAHASALHDLGVERDKAHARKSTLPTLRASLEAALVTAATEDARTLARERRINFRWTSAIAEERLIQAEARLAFESRRVEAIDLDIKAYELQVKAIQKLLEALSKRYAAVAERRKLALQTEAVLEQARAAASDDPVVKFTARRSSEIHEMEAQLVEYDRLLSANPALSLEEQKALADHAESDLASLKQVVQENRVGGLVALRLNNDFRRLSRERALVQRNELAQSSALNAHYENALTETELSFINDTRDDQFERDAFIETLPAAVRSSAGAAIDALDARHKDRLARKKAVLEKLLDRAEGTHKQVARRLRILDEQYAFIRTHIFWVRDSEPLGGSTLVQARRDVAKLAAAAIRLGSEPLDRMLWTPVSADFGLMVAGLLILPPAIIYARRRLKALIASPRTPTIIVRID
jgi:potassium efflux system protein